MKILVVLIGVFAAIAAVFGVQSYLSEVQAVAIIGGADGPTSIFLAGKVGGGDIFIGLAVAVVMILLIIWLINKGKKKKDL